MHALMHKWPRLNLVVSQSLINKSINKKYSQEALSKIHFTLEVSLPGTKLLNPRKSRKHCLGISLRTLSTLENPYRTTNTNLTMAKNDVPEYSYMENHTDIAQDLARIAERYKSQEAAVRFKEALQYNLPVTLSKGSLIPMLTYKSLVTGDQIDADKLKLAHLLGWCLEVLHCIILISDDMMENNTTRRGQSCWYKLKEVGLLAVNDAFMIENGAYELLQKYFSHMDCYVELIELLRQSTFKCLSGQALDKLSSKRNVRTFSRDTYDALVMNKTTSHVFYLPIAMGLVLAGVKDQKVFDECKTLTFELGYFSQVRNDFLNCFGDPVGTDIQANKCSWLAIKCMELARPEQKEIVEECYGQDDPEKIARVKQIYEELNLPSIYSKYEIETYNKNKALIQQASDAVPRKILLEILNTIYQKDL